MRSSIYFLVFSTIWLKCSLTTGNNYILCTSRCSNLTIPFSQAKTIPTECQEQDNSMMISDYGLFCSVEYQINYETEEIQIFFQALNETNHFDVHQASHVFLQKISLNLVGDNNPNDETVRKYFCNTKNDCAREFYLNTVEHLVGAGKEKFDLIKNKLYNSTLLMNERSRRRCFDSDKSDHNRSAVLCRTGLCYAHYVHEGTNEKHENKTQKCHIGDRLVLISEIEHQLSSSNPHGKELLEYRCNKNVCNRNDMIHIIQKLIHEYTHWKLTAADIKQHVAVKKSDSSSMKSIFTCSVLVLFVTSIQLFF